MNRPLPVEAHDNPCAYHANQVRTIKRSAAANRVLNCMAPKMLASLRSIVESTTGNIDKQGLPLLHQDELLKAQFLLNEIDSAMSKL